MKGTISLCMTTAMILLCVYADTNEQTVEINRKYPLKEF